MKFIPEKITIKPMIIVKNCLDCPNIRTRIGIGNNEVWNYCSLDEQRKHVNQWRKIDGFPLYCQLKDYIE